MEQRLDQFWLTEAQFATIAPHLPSDTRDKPRVNDRRVISGIVHVLKSGGRWVDAPPNYGPRKTLYYCFVRWAAKGVWVDLFQALAQAGGPPAQMLIDCVSARGPDADRRRKCLIDMVYQGDVGAPFHTSALACRPGRHRPRVQPPAREAAGHPSAGHPSGDRRSRRAEEGAQYW